MDDGRLALGLAALGSAIRLALFRRLLELGAAGAGPTVLADHVGLERNLVSYHLRPLLAARLVRAERRGRDMCYSVDRKSLAGFATALQDMVLTQV